MNEWMRKISIPGDRLPTSNRIHDLQQDLRECRTRHHRLLDAAKEWRDTEAFTTSERLQRDMKLIGAIAACEDPGARVYPRVNDKNVPRR